VAQALHFLFSLWAQALGSHIFVVPVIIVVVITVFPQAVWEV